MGGIFLANFKLFYKVIDVNTGQYWNKDRFSHQWVRIEYPTANSQGYSQLIFDKDVENIKWDKYGLFDKGY